MIFHPWQVKKTWKGSIESSCLPIPILQFGMPENDLARCITKYVICCMQKNTRMSYWIRSQFEALRTSMLFQLFRPTILWHMSRCVTQLYNNKIQRTVDSSVTDVDEWWWKHTWAQFLCSLCSSFPRLHSYRSKRVKVQGALRRWSVLCVPAECIIIRPRTRYHYPLTWVL